MIIYIIMIFLSLVFTAFAIKVKDKKIKIILYILAALPIFIVPAIRYDVGTDYKYRYVGDFKKIASGETIDNLEFGFVMLIKLCLLFSNSSQLLFIVTSALITFLLMHTIFKYSKNPIISILLFFLGRLFFPINEYGKTIFGNDNCAFWI